MAESMRFRSGADDKYVSRIQAAIETPVQHNAIHEAPHTQRDRHQAHCAEHNAARNIGRVNQVQRPSSNRPK